MWHVCGRGEVNFCWGNLRKRDLGVDGRIILKLIFKKSVGGVDCIDLAQDTEMNLRVAYNAQYF
jgi:hypothetical protein